MTILEEVPNPTGTPLATKQTYGFDFRWIFTKKKHGIFPSACGKPRHILTKVGVSEAIIRCEFGLWIYHPMGCDHVKHGGVPYMDGLCHGKSQSINGLFRGSPILGNLYCFFVFDRQNSSLHCEQRKKTTLNGSMIHFHGCAVKLRLSRMFTS